MLKRFFTYILLLTMSLRPAYYIGTVAYFETHLSEIIQEFCVNKEVPELQCNGQCHLAKQLTIAQPTSKETDGQGYVQISLAFYPVFFQEITETTIEKINFYKDSKTFFYKESYQYLSSVSFLKPPEFI